MKLPGPLPMVLAERWRLAPSPRGYPLKGFPSAVRQSVRLETLRPTLASALESTSVVLRHWQEIAQLCHVSDEGVVVNTTKIARIEEAGKPACVLYRQGRTNAKQNLQTSSILSQHGHRLQDYYKHYNLPYFKGAYTYL